MALVGIYGEKNDVTPALMMYACDNGPTLVVGSGLPDHAAFDVYVVQCELSSMFFDIIKRLHRTADEMGVKTVVITSLDMLYGDLLEHAWVILSRLAVEYDVVVAVNDGAAQKYCNLVIPVREWLIEAVRLSSS